MPPTADANLDELKRKARRRLVGAVVLALAAAVFVPMLLESDERPLGDDVSVRIPAVDPGKFVNRINSPGGGDKAAAKPVPPPPAAATSVVAPAPAAPTAAGGGDGTTASSPPTTANPAPAPATRETAVRASAAPAAPADATSAAAKPVTLAPAKSAAEPVAKTPSTPKAVTGGFVVQLAAFADDKGANALANRLKKTGHPAFTEPVTTSRGTLWRVRVGPYATRDEANNARDRLKREGQNGIVAARS
jgi:DedD protein